MNAPVILQISPVVAEFMGYDYWGMIAGEMARRSTAEVVLHLDHANMVEPIWKALDAGFLQLCLTAPSSLLRIMCVLPMKW